MTTTFTIFFFFSMTVVWCQSMEVGVIDFYGPRSDDMELRSCLPFREYDTIELDSIASSLTTLSKYKQTLLDCFKRAQPNIKQVDLAFVCCVNQDNKWIVYVGVDTTLIKRSEDNKTSDIKLPGEITSVYDSLMNLLIVAVQLGEADEDYSDGHSLMKYLPARKLQEEFVKFADIHLNLVREVLKTSIYSNQRAVAATVIGYYHDKAEIINELLEAVSDSDNEVRNNAIRAIGIITEYAQSRPDLKIEIPADPFIALMNSVQWSDRNKSVSVLRVLSSSNDEKLLAKLKSEALESLVDMARWKSEGHSYTGYLILGRIAGWSEEALNFDSFRKNKSELMNKLMKTIK